MHILYQVSLFVIIFKFKHIEKIKKIKKIKINSEKFFKEKKTNNIIKKFLY